MFLRRNVGLARRARGITLLLQLFVSDVKNSPRCEEMYEKKVCPG